MKTAADNLKSEIYKNLLTNDRKPVIIIIYFFSLSKNNIANAAILVGGVIYLMEER